MARLNKMVSALLDVSRLELGQLSIQNALKYSQPPEPVSVTVTYEATQVCIAVRDRGMGIPSAALPHLFQRFYRADNVEERQISGMGIGLYVVKEIVTLHDGEITVESTEGVGSTFVVCLPQDDSDGADEAIPAAHDTRALTRIEDRG